VALSYTKSELKLQNFKGLFSRSASSIPHPECQSLSSRHGLS